MTSRPSLRAGPRTSGAELAEFGLLLPFLVLLILVVSAAAALVSAHQVLNRAVREGALLATAPGAYGNQSAVQNAVVSYAASNGVTLSTANVAVNQDLVINPGLGPCSSINICMPASQVSVAYNFTLPFPIGAIATVPLGAAVEMRNLY